MGKEIKYCTTCKILNQPYRGNRVELKDYKQKTYIIESVESQDGRVSMEPTPYKYCPNCGQLYLKVLPED